MTLVFKCGFRFCYLLCIFLSVGECSASENSVNPPVFQISSDKRVVAYVVASTHTGLPRDRLLNPDLVSLIQKAARIYFESNALNLQLAEEIAALLKTTFRKGWLQKNIKDELMASQPLQSELAEQLPELIRSMDLEHPFVVVNRVISRFCPVQGLSDRHGVDFLIRQNLGMRDLELEYLETSADQLDWLRAVSSADWNLALSEALKLIGSHSDCENYKKLRSRAVEYYSAGNLEALKALSLQHLQAFPKLQHIFVDVFIQRDDQLSRRLLQAVREIKPGSTDYAVFVLGALHLADDGVLMRIRNAGYQVTRVK